MRPYNAALPKRLRPERSIFGFTSGEMRRGDLDRALFGGVTAARGSDASLRGATNTSAGAAAPAIPKRERAAAAMTPTTAAGSRERTASPGSPLPSAAL